MSIQKASPQSALTFSLSSSSWSLLAGMAKGELGPRVGDDTLPSQALSLMMTSSLAWMVSISMPLVELAHLALQRPHFLLEAFLLQAEPLQLAAEAQDLLVLLVQELQCVPGDPLADLGVREILVILG